MSKKREFSAIESNFFSNMREDNTPGGTVSSVKAPGEVAPTDESIKEFLRSNGYKLEPTEYKSKRINVLLQPSVHDKVKAIAKKRKTSVNAIIEEAIKKYIEEA